MTRRSKPTDIETPSGFAACVYPRTWENIVFTMPDQIACVSRSPILRPSSFPCSGFTIPRMQMRHDRLPLRSITPTTIPTSVHFYGGLALFAFQPRFVQFWIPFPRGKSNRSRVKELVQGYQWVSLKKSFQSFNSRFKRCDTIRNRSINLPRGQDFGMVTRHSSRVQPIFRGSTSFPYTLDHALLPLRLCKARGGGWGWMHAVDHVATFFFFPPTARKFPRNTLVTHAMYLSSSRDNDFLHVFPTREQAQG